MVTKRVPELNTAAPQSPVLPDWSPRSQSPGPEAEGHYNYIEGFNGRVYAGSRVKTQWAIAEGGDGQWYRGTAYHIFPAEGTATIKFDDKDFVRLEVDVRVRPHCTGTGTSFAVHTIGMHLEGFFQGRPNRVSSPPAANNALLRQTLIPNRSSNHQ